MDRTGTDHGHGPGTGRREKPAGAPALTLTFALAAALAMALAACGANLSPDRGPELPAEDTPARGRNAAGASPDSAGKAVMGASPDRTEKRQMAASLDGTEKGEMIASPDSAGKEGMGAYPGGAGSEKMGREPPRLKAGETDDNERWEEYLSYLKRYSGKPAVLVDVSGRVLITVRDGAGRPVHGASVTVTGAGGEELARAVTYTDGRTLFLPEPGTRGPVRLTASLGGAEASLDPADPAEGHWSIVMDTVPEDTGETPARTPLDILFLLDATGSMADEIDRIKSTLSSIAAQVSDLPQNPDLRFGMVAYRDLGDEYVTRTHDFDGNVERFRRTIDGVRAEGGGDEPESLNEGLHQAVNGVSWRETGAVRLVFLVADAPPHLDYGQQEYGQGRKYDYTVEAARAREAGIKVFAVATSGLDRQGEYVFRQIAQQTMGKFIFILYESGPQGALDTPHDVGGDFTVNNLDGLIVRLIQEELEHLEPDHPGRGADERGNQDRRP